MNNSFRDVIIVGAGHAGLAASYYLKKAGIEHIVLERGKVGETWRSQRWRSFRMNSVNRLNLLPGAELDGRDPEAFCTHDDFALSLEHYVARFGLPVLEHSRVISIEKPSDVFKVTFVQDNLTNEFFSKQIIVCSGLQNEIKVPSYSGNISAGVEQLHTREYRDASALPSGAVLVVGSGQSGVQIADDLLDSGRKVYLSTSMVGRAPRRYRGKDIMDWLLMSGFFDLKTEEITDPKELAMKPPQLTGTGVMPRTISLQHLATKGAVILGRVKYAEDHNIYFEPNAQQHVQFADMVSKKLKDMIDGFIARAGLQTPPAEEDEIDLPDPGATCASCITALDLKAHDITSIVWTTGFKGDLSYLKLPVLHDNGNPRHSNGISDVEGLYFLGFGWLRSRKSSLIYGVNDDAPFICEQVCSHATKRKIVA